MEDHERPEPGDSPIEHVAPEKRSGGTPPPKPPSPPPSEGEVGS
jgi:hypothetical protein